MGKKELVGRKRQAERRQGQKMVEPENRVSEEDRDRDSEGGKSLAERRQDKHERRRVKPENRG
jgi:hypothetical protein